MTLGGATTVDNFDFGYARSSNFTDNPGEFMVRNTTLSIHPNPSTGKFTVTLQTLAPQVNLSVNDMVGRTIQSSVLTVQNNSVEHVVDLKESAKGVYTLNIEMGGKRVVRKIVVE